MTNHRDLFTALAAPFAARDVKHKPGGNGRQLAYVTARTIMNRLDEVLGPENWWDDYTPMPNSVICRLSIRLPDGTIVTKCDAGGCAGLTDAGDDDKSGFSDAFKRTAVKFGPGRYLYRDGVATLTSPSPEASVTQIPGEIPAEVVVPQPRPAPARPGAEDSQGRGGAVVYGRARARGKANARPTTGEDLHYYAIESTLDPNLANWIVNSFNPQGWPDKIVNWTPDEVRQAWPSIREHLETCKAARARMKASV